MENQTFNWFHLILIIIIQRKLLYSIRWWALLQLYFKSWFLIRHLWAVFIRHNATSFVDVPNRWWLHWLNFIIHFNLVDLVWGLSSGRKDNLLRSSLRHYGHLVGFGHHPIVFGVLLFGKLMVCHHFVHVSHFFFVLVGVVCVFLIVSV